MTAYNVIISQQKVDLNNPALSRVYLRPSVDRHNCGATASCDRVAADLLAAIQAWAQQRPAPTPTQTTLKSSKTSFAAATAGGGARAQAAQIAFFDFEEGTGTTTADTSGVGTAMTLQLTGTEWVEGGLKIVTGKAQASLADSQKLFNAIMPTGAFSAEAWLIPENTTQDRARANRELLDEHGHAQFHDRPGRRRLPSSQSQLGGQCERRSVPRGNRRRT